MYLTKGGDAMTLQEYIDNLQLGLLVYVTVLIVCWMVTDGLARGYRTYSNDPLETKSAFEAGVREVQFGVLLAWIVGFLALLVGVTLGWSLLTGVSSVCIFYAVKYRIRKE